MPNTPILQEIHAELSLWQKIKLLAKIYMRQLYELLRLGFQTAHDLVGVIVTLGYYNPFKTDSPGKIMVGELGQEPMALPSGVEITTARQEWNGQLVLELGGNLYEYCTDADLDRWYEYGLNPGEVARIVNQRQGVNDKPKKKKKSSSKSKTDDAVVNTLGSWTVKEYGIMDGFGREIYSNYRLDFTKGGKVIFVVDDKVTPITSRDEAYQWFKRVFNDPNPQIEYYENQNAMPYQAGNKPNPVTYHTGSVPQGSYYVDLRWDTVANGPVDYNGWYESSDKK